LTICTLPLDAESCPRPNLTRRRDPDAQNDCWRILCGDADVGMTGVRWGAPHDQWPSSSFARIEGSPSRTQSAAFASAKHGHASGDPAGERHERNFRDRKLNKDDGI
jgi:hypothetical protein